MQLNTQAFDAAVECVALATETQAEALVLGGPELEDWIGGVITKPLPAPGSIDYALMLTPKATRIADFWIWRLQPNTIALEVHPSLIAELEDALKRFRISAKVTIERQQWPRLELVGPRAPDAIARALGAAAGQLPQSGHEIADTGELAIARRRRLGLAGICVHPQAQRADELHERLVQAVGDLGGTELTDTAAQWIRIALGHPEAVDVEPERFVAETPLFERGVDLGQGSAFIGMQPLLRVTHRGHVNRNTRILLARAGDTLRQGEAITVDGRNVGTAGPAGFAPSAGASTALCFIRTSVETGTTVAVGDTPTYAEVRDPPLIKPA